MEQPTGETTPEILHAQKVLRVDENFGIYTQGNTRLLADLWIGGETFHFQADILKAFENSGYVVARGGKFNINNPFELGIFIEKHSDIEIANKLRIQMPPRKPIGELWADNKPVVVKATFADRGEFKYLLENNDQKAKFATWWLAFDRGLMHKDERLAKAELLDLLKQVKSGSISGEDLTNSESAESWFIEDFIVTPGDYNTSFRILADGYGNVHYGQLNRSSEARGVRKMILKKGYVPIFEGSMLGDMLTNLLIHPRSPLYLDSTEFVSNISQGGNRILLDGQPVISDIDREILKAHRLDTEKPFAPDEILEIASHIGVLNRDSYPYTGVDFIQDREGNFYFLEANSGPMLNPRALGLSERSTNHKRVLEMMRRVASSKPK